MADENRLRPGLYVVATPIGNLADLGRRAAETLKLADRILAEDTRVTGKLLAHIGAKAPMSRYDDHSSDAERERIVGQLGDSAVALVSDAGTPLISDPGYKLVRGRAVCRPYGAHPPRPERSDRRADAGWIADRPLPVRRFPPVQGESAPRRPSPSWQVSVPPWFSTKAARALPTRWPHWLPSSARGRPLSRARSQSCTRNASPVRLAELAARYVCFNSQGRDRHHRRPAG